MYKRIFYSFKEKNKSRDARKNYLLNYGPALAIMKVRSG